MFKLKWKITGIYLLITVFTLFMVWVGITVETKGQVKNLVTILFVAILFTTPLAYFFAASFGARINELNKGTKSLVSGITMPKGFNDSGDELGELGGNIYLVARKLQATIQEISSESNKMSAILTGMLEGVVALDHVGRIVLMNRAASSMFGRPEQEVKFRYITDLIKDTGVAEIMRMVLEKGESAQHEFWFSDRNLRILMSPVISEHTIQGVVMVIQDVTEVRRLEQLRTDFVANVSHELRTPLTSIKGFVETLLDGVDNDPELRKRFLQIIHDETGRLHRLIEDLFTLANLESRPKTGSQKASVKSAYSRVAQVLDPLAKVKNIELNVEIAEELPRAKIGEELLSQVFLNLMENGIKYTPAGGKVWLKVSGQNQWLNIEVGDTGPGIPKESLPRIFERFYRVDKGRSREMGGTGLGLSIVKHIVEQANGELQVDSELGKGTRFTVSLPQGD